MAKRKKDSVDTLPGRINWLMKKLWRNSQTAMADDLGVAQSTIANVLARRRKAGQPLMSALAAHPLVNESWLKEGSGPPILLEAAGAGGEIALPIARRLFGGLPLDHPDCLAEVLYPVPRRLYRDSRYWIHVDEDKHPFTAIENSPICCGDWVLMEPSRQEWPRDLRASFCLAAAVIDDDERLFCCRNVSATKGAGTALDFDFGGQVASIEDAGATKDQHGRPLRSIKLGSETKRAKRVPVTVVAVATYRCGELCASTKKADGASRRPVKK